MFTATVQRGNWFPNSELKASSMPPGFTCVIGLPSTLLLRTKFVPPMPARP